MATLKDTMKSRLRRVIQFVDSARADPGDTALPVNPLSSDVYFITYPKSGTAWFAFLLGNINLLMSGMDRRMTFFGGDDIIPSLEISRHIPQPSTSFPGFRMIHSHSPYNPHFKNVLLLVRNPVEVMTSYYNYLQQLGAFSGDIRQFVDHPSFGIRAWISHTSGWLDGARASRVRTSLCLVKYEDLRDNPASELREIYSLMGFNLPDPVISAAIERSSLKAMQADEKRFNARNPAWVGFEHVRNEQNAGMRVPIDSDIVEKIRILARPLLDRLGYQ